MKVLISGSHGLIGRALVPALESAGHNVTRLVRHDASQTPRSAPAPSGPVISWDPFTRQVEEGEGDLSGLDGFDAVIHLAGAGIGDRRWNQAHKGVVRDSRLGPTKALAEALARCPRPPSVFVCASAIGYYGPGSAGAHAGEATLTEDSPPGLGFLARLCLDWEQACSALAQAGTRVVNARTGIVQATTGGVLARQLPLFRLGLGARLGSGQQWVSWITLDDEVAAIAFVLTNSELSGPVNLVAPNPVTNSAYTAALAHSLHRPALLSVPTPVLGLALGREMASELLLASQKVAPTKLVQAGFTFRHPELAGALAFLLAA